ncbi:MAG: indole-3-glycerol phosphate synthase TrpC [Planctomycetota bacterium]|jgi:indole-3-glycerol phosphate synthase
MTRFLERVLDEKRQEIEEKKELRPFSELAFWASLKDIRNFRKALSGKDRIIAEVKKRSPSVEAFKQTREPAELVWIYENHGAAAISIVTDEKNFGTSLADVEEVRKAVTLPVLVKDFIFDPYQVLEARAVGADAVLLIARILSPTQLRDLLVLTRDLGFYALVECHDSKDIEMASESGAEIIGVNSRDLDTLKVSLDTTGKLLGSIPNGAIRIAESGIGKREDVKALKALGADAFLVGGALLNADDPGAKLEELLGSRDEREASNE